MAINLDHFKLAEDQNLFYRRVGMPAVDDFLNRGAIAGTQKYGTEAYFLRGAEWSTGGAPYKITADMSRLNPVNNPLYGDVGVNRYLTQEGAFPIGKSAMASGQYPRLTPNNNPSFIDTINPANRSGIKIEDTRTGEVFYDRTRPITKTPIRTTLKNINAESRILGNAVLQRTKIMGTSEYDTPITYTDRRGVVRIGYKPFFADEFANNPNSSFRLVGGYNPYHNVQTELLNQFEKTGQIIGGETADSLTYFAKGGTSAGDYLPIVMDKRGEVAHNLLYEVNPRFNPNRSNLYSVVGGFTDNELHNTNQILKPNKDATWSQRVDPFARRGIKISKFDTTENWHDPRTQGTAGMRYSTPLGESVHYDRTLPFYKTSLRQNLNNLSVEAKILMSQPETQAVVRGATRVGGASAFLLDTPENMSVLDRRRREQITGAGPRDASVSEVAGMFGKGAVRSVINGLTFGMAGTSGDLNRPATGIRRMQSTGDEMSRRTMERANNWTPSVDDRYERIGISFDHVYPQAPR